MKFYCQQCNQISDNAAHFCNPLLVPTAQPTKVLVFEGKMDDAEEEDGGCALIVRGLINADWPPVLDMNPDDNILNPGFRLDVVSWHEPEDDGPPQHTFITENLGKRVRVTFEFLED